MSKNSLHVNCRLLVGASAALTAALVWPPLTPLEAQQAPATCAVTGKILSGTTPLPGVSVTARAGDRLVGATSSAVDGSYKLSLPPDAEYRITVEMTAFARGEQTIAVGAVPCEGKTDFALVLASRAPNAVASAAPALAPVAAASAATPPSGRAGAAGPAGQRFSTLNVQQDETAAAALLGTAFGYTHICISWSAPSHIITCSRSFIPHTKYIFCPFAYISCHIVEA
jgi:hypothetical protein